MSGRPSGSKRKRQDNNSIIPGTEFSVPNIAWLTSEEFITTLKSSDYWKSPLEGHSITKEWMKTVPSNILGSLPETVFHFVIECVSDYSALYTPELNQKAEIIDRSNDDFIDAVEAFDQGICDHLYEDNCKNFSKKNRIPRHKIKDNTHATLAVINTRTFNAYGDKVKKLCYSALVTGGITENLLIEVEKLHPNGFTKRFTELFACVAAFVASHMTEQNCKIYYKLMDELSSVSDTTQEIVAEGGASGSGLAEGGASELGVSKDTSEHRQEHTMHNTPIFRNKWMEEKRIHVNSNEFISKGCWTPMEIAHAREKYINREITKATLNRLIAEINRKKKLQMAEAAAAIASESGGQMPRLGDEFDPIPPPQAAVEPAAVEPAAVEPAAVEPAAVEPAAVEPSATKTTKYLVYYKDSDGVSMILTSTACQQPQDILERPDADEAAVRTRLAKFPNAKWVMVKVNATTNAVACNLGSTATDNNIYMLKRDHQRSDDNKRLDISMDCSSLHTLVSSNFHNDTVQLLIEMQKAKLMDIVGLPAFEYEKLPSKLKSVLPGPVKPSKFNARSNTIVSYPASLVNEWKKAHEEASGGASRTNAAITIDLTTDDTSAQDQPTQSKGTD